jgi:DNA-binding IclR family transcriptional regulator
MLVSDGAWYGFSEISDALGIDRERLKRIVEFLAEFDLVQTRGNKIRIDFETKRLLKSINSDLEKKRRAISRDQL